MTPHHLRRTIRNQVYALIVAIVALAGIAVTRADQNAAHIEGTEE